MDLDTLLQRALSLADDGDWVSAAELLREQLGDFGDEASLHCALGVAERELGRAMAEFRASGGTAIVQDVRNGEILAMVSLPQFDPTQPPAGDPDKRFNRATLGVYEMGSTFKIFTIAMALESGRATLASGYDARKPIRISRFVIRDYHAKRRWLSVPEIII